MRTARNMHHCPGLFVMTMAILFVFAPLSAFPEEMTSLLDVTPGIKEYAMNSVQPVLVPYTAKDTVSLLIKVSSILIDPELGIGKNKIEPAVFFAYRDLKKTGKESRVTSKLSREQGMIVEDWCSRFMQDNPADVFFAQSADDIVRTKAAFGCSHYARSFVAVVKALGLIDSPENMRYVVSSKANDYNEALENSDSRMTINGHQFVMVKVDSRWIAINTSKAEWTEMPEGFTPDSIGPPRNTAVHFKSYPDAALLLRKIGKDYNDDCNDNSLVSLMNISRSGNARNPAFKWEVFERIVP